MDGVAPNPGSVGPWAPTDHGTCSSGSPIDGTSGIHGSVPMTSHRNSDGASYLIQAAEIVLPCSELDQTLATLARALTTLCALFEPVAPAKMAELSERLGLQGVPTLEEARSVVLANRRVTKAPPLFPRVDPSWATGGG